MGETDFAKRIMAGTPHRGSDATAVMTKILRLSIVSSTVNTNLAGLDKRSMQITNESWLHLSHMYQVASFYETIPSGISVRQMVRAFSNIFLGSFFKFLFLYHALLY